MGPNHVSIPVNANSWGRFAEGLEKGLENGGVEFSNRDNLQNEPNRYASDCRIGNVYEFMMLS
jgi:hypothetical protein